MAAELGGLFLSGGLLLAATTFAGRKRARQEDDASIARAISNARSSFDKEYNDALTRSIDTICLATRFDKNTSYQALQRDLNQLSVASEFIHGDLNSTPSLDINLTFLLGNVPSFQKERELFQALAKEGVILCPGEARGHSTPGHFFVTAPVNTDNEAHLISQRIAKVIKSYLATHPSAHSPINSSDETTEAATTPAKPAAAHTESAETPVTSTAAPSANPSTVTSTAVTTPQSAPAATEESVPKQEEKPAPENNEPIYESEAESVASRTKARKTGRTPSAKARRGAI